jgi:hypothetical protein
MKFQIWLELWILNDLRTVKKQLMEVEQALLDAKTRSEREHLESEKADLLEEIGSLILQSETF